MGYTLIEQCQTLTFLREHSLKLTQDIPEKKNRETSSSSIALRTNILPDETPTNRTFTVGKTLLIVLSLTWNWIVGIKKWLTKRFWNNVLIEIYLKKFHNKYLYSGELPLCKSHVRIAWQLMNVVPKRKVRLFELAQKSVNIFCTSRKHVIKIVIALYMTINIFGKWQKPFHYPPPPPQDYMPSAHNQ